MKQGLIVFLNGTSSSGKTSISTELINQKEILFYHLSIDDFCNNYNDFINNKFPDDPIREVDGQVVAQLNDSINSVYYSTIKLLSEKGIDFANRIGEIKRFFVLPEYQNKGCGKSMMSQVIEFARQAGLKKLRLDTEKQSYKAMSVFRSFGFYEIPKYNDNDFAGIFMELSIVS